MRHKFEELDGLRGVAAIAVMLWHRREWFGGDAFLGHAYLAVDFFFMLSGFVIAHAYGERLAGGGSPLAFLRSRVIRLHPLLAAGALLGCLVLVIEIRTGAKPVPELPGLTFLSALVPFPAMWVSGGEAFPINNPAWSLFWELTVNLLFALIATRLTDRRLGAIIGVSAVAMIYCSAVSIGFKGGRVQAEILQGLPRVSLSFFMGVLLLRLFNRGWRIPLPNAPGAVAAILVGSFWLLPVWHPWSAVYDPVVVIGVYPGLLLWAAASTPALPRLTALAGAISYPLYILHLPLLQLVNGVRRALVGGTADQPGVAGGLVCLATVLLMSYAALRLYDEPVRIRLRSRVGSRVRGRRPGGSPARVRRI